MPKVALDIFGFRGVFRPHVVLGDTRFSGPRNLVLPLTGNGTWTKLPDPLSILQPQFPPLDIGMVRALPVPQGEGHLIGGECLKELGFIVAVSICAGSEDMASRAGVVYASGV